MDAASPHYQAKLYRRYHFLLFDQDTISSPGNLAVYQRLQGKQNLPAADPLENELWQQWKNFPQFPFLDPAKDFTDGSGLEFMTWLVHTFARSVCCSGSKDDRYHKKLVEKGLDFMTVDDLVFIFMQVQHNIGKWTLFHGAIRRGELRENVIEKNYTKEETTLMKQIEENNLEYKNGEGVSGEDGQIRYVGMIKFFHLVYWHRHEQTNEYLDYVKANRSALLDALKDMIEKERGDEEEAPAPSSKKKSKKSKVKELSNDTVLTSIYNDAWADVTEV